MSVAIGLSPDGIIVAPCPGVGKVNADYIDKAGAERGDYIFYDQVWIREVIGNSTAGGDSKKIRSQVIFLFGHELGHILSRHFTANAQMSRLQKESDADHFGGCAAGVLLTKWEHVQDLIQRIRDAKDSLYPGRQRSMALARAGFEKCRPKTGETAIEPLLTRLNAFPLGHSESLMSEDDRITAGYSDGDRMAYAQHFDTPDDKRSDYHVYYFVDYGKITDIFISYTKSIAGLRTTKNKVLFNNECARAAQAFREEIENQTGLIGVETSNSPSDYPGKMATALEAVTTARSGDLLLSVYSNFGYSAMTEKEIRFDPKGYNPERQFHPTATCHPEVWIRKSR